MFERLEYPRERSYQCASSERERERQTERMMGLLVPADAQEESVSICPCIQPILLKSFHLQTYTHTHTHTLCMKLSGLRLPLKLLSHS